MAVADESRHSRGFDDATKEEEAALLQDDVAKKKKKVPTTFIMVDGLVLSFGG